jgi:hypothetical protein
MNFFVHITFLALIAIVQASAVPSHQHHERRQLRKANTVKGMNGNVEKGGKHGKSGMPMKFGKSVNGGMVQGKRTNRPIASPSPVQSPEEMPHSMCFAQVDIECIPPINPQAQNGERFKDCDSIIIQDLNCSESPCIFPVSFNLSITNTDAFFGAEISSLSSITNFDKPNDFLNYTADVSGIPVGPRDTVIIPGRSIDIDLSVPKRYTVYTVVQELSSDGSSCRGADFLAFTVGNLNSPPTVAPVISPLSPED